ncbi:MAG: stage III sporulation protein AB [Eubacteriales bacterium]|nr:stage III sporulation protein AB [Eubacteriales bacterium]
MRARLLLMAASGLLCFAFSNAMAGEAEARVKVLRDLARDVAAMRGWMAGSLPPVRVMLTRLCEGSLEPIWETMLRELARTDSFCKAWKACISAQRLETLKPLSEEEYRLVWEFGDIFGTTRDRNTQLGAMDDFLLRLRACTEEARAQAMKKGRLYRSLGTLSGLALALAIC